MVGTALWMLNLADQAGTTPAYSAASPIAAMGNPWAIALNMDVAYADVTTAGTLAWVAAAEYVSLSNRNNNVTDAGNNQIDAADGWDFTAPQIDTTPGEVATVYDDVIRIRFTDELENTANQITAAITANLVNLNSAGPLVAVTSASTDELGATSINTVDDYGAANAFYIHSPQRWRTDADGTTAGDVNSTDQNGNAATVVPDISMPKAASVAFREARECPIEHIPQIRETIVCIS